MKIIFMSLMFLGLNVESKTFSIMSYNLENFFDTTHDENKEDYTYLPLKVKKRSRIVREYCEGLSNSFYRKNCLTFDWNNSVYHSKIKNIAKVILSYNKGRGPDIVVLQEIENKNSLKDLITKGLNKKSGYRYISLIEGPDRRGIDVAIFSRYKIVSNVYHKVDISQYSRRPTRGILETNLNIGGKLVTVFANHWPSQNNDDLTRLKAAKTLLKAVESKSKSAVIIAAGDFNTVKDDEINGLTEHIIPNFYDVEVKGRKLSRYKETLKGGTHFYKGNWGSLDKIFVYKKSGRFKVHYRDFNILSHAFMLTDVEWEDRSTGKVTVYKDVPYRFDPKTRKGFSDHLPLVIKIQI